jgi:hypothetical protein
VTIRPSRLTLLFFRSRATEQTLIILTLLAVAATIAFVTTDNPDLTPILLMVIPLAAAVVVGAATGSPFGEAERTASHSIPTLRGTHLALLLVCGGIGLAIASFAQADDPLGTLLRNGAGFAGLALIGARLFGSGASWLLPLGYGGVAFVDYLFQPDLDAGWRWPLQSTSDETALALALALFAFGISVIVIAGSRESPGETA